MDMKQFLHQASEGERQALADAVGTTVAYFWQISGKHRKPGARLCRLIEEHSNGKITAHELRPDYFPVSTKK